MSTPTSQSFILRPLHDDDRVAYGEMVHDAFNTWYWQHGWGRGYFQCSPADAAVFYDIYNDLTPGCSVAAFSQNSGQLLGACFYHPRERHVSLGIMSVHTAHRGQGIGRALVNEIVRFTEEGGYPALRLVSSAMNMDSFSLYNRAGLIPRQKYHDMVIAVPATGDVGRQPLRERVRPATIDDVAAMAALEEEISGIRRELDYRYAIANPGGWLHAQVIESEAGGIEGWLVCVRHPALNMIGPGIARTEEGAAALILSALERFRGQKVLLVIPMDKRLLVETLYGWGARNVEIHLFQVRGEFQPFAGVSLPSFLPETG
ncbi:MAG: GNAT family N-acetyltransferase [Nitrosospira sp.]|nr:GNAT family N-acetyltransferase [Nitrosospira sp.]